MKKSGIIYQKNYPAKRQIWINPPRHKAILFKSIRYFGALLSSVSIASVILLYNPAPSLPSALMPEEKQTASEIQQSLANPETSAVSSIMQKLYSPIKQKTDSHFFIDIPKIKAGAPVVENINPFDEAEYSEVLTEAVAHSATSYLPGRGGTVYLFAHSTSSSILSPGGYNRIFYNLRNLIPGDIIRLEYEDQIYIYKVKEIIVTSASDTSWLIPKREPTLILQTCDPPGTDWRRLLVISQLSEIKNNTK